MMLLLSVFLHNGGHFYAEVPAETCLNWIRRNMRRSDIACMILFPASCVFPGAWLWNGRITKRSNVEPNDDETSLPSQASTSLH